MYPPIIPTIVGIIIMYLTTINILGLITLPHRAANAAAYPIAAYAHQGMAERNIDAAVDASALTLDATCPAALNTVTSASTKERMYIKPREYAAFAKANFALCPSVK